jgi:hypothetical protein
VKTIRPKARNKRNDLNAAIAPIKNLRGRLFCLGRKSSRLRIDGFEFGAELDKSGFIDSAEKNNDRG